MIKQQLEFTKQRYLSKELKVIQYKKSFGVTGRPMGQMINFNTQKHQRKNFVFPVKMEDKILGLLNRLKQA